MSIAFCYIFLLYFFSQRLYNVLGGIAMNKVKEICVRKGIVQKELASLVGVSQPTVSDWFNNKKDPSGARLEKLAAVLDVSRAVILGLDDIPDQPKTEKAPADDRAEAKRILESMTDEEYERAVAVLKALRNTNKGNEAK